MSSAAMPVASLGPDDLRSLSFSLLGRALRIYSMFDDLDAPLVRRDPPSLLRIRNHAEEAAALRELVEDIIAERPLAAERLDDVGAHIQHVLDSKTIEEALDNFQKIRELIARLLPSQTVKTSHDAAFTTSRGSKTLDVVASPSNRVQDDLKKALDQDVNEQRFVAAVMQMCAEHRGSKDTAFTPDEEIALERAYSLLDQGVRLPRFYRSIDHTAERQVQTYVSFADPGDGHLTVTVRSKELLDGLIVHIEYIDRDGVDDKDRVEAYRLPAIRNAARVRMHVGDATPCTAFIGRPVFEGGDFNLGLLKAAHTMAGVCSAMFAHGVADCKVAMDGMSAQQAVDFMRVVAGNVVRNPLRQRLSAAFNLNSPLKDDITSKAASRLITDRFEIAKMAIRLTAKGRFNKIAWDGASNERPGKAILTGQLTRAQLLELVHSAHARDLETYISAGMQPEHMRDAVFVGVGGVGIGTSLHELAPDKTIGEIAPAKVVSVLEIQKKAAETVAGRAARALALIDWESAQRHPLPALKLTRHKLFERLSAYMQVLDKTYGNVPTGKNTPQKDSAGKEMAGADVDTFNEKKFAPQLAKELEELLDEVKAARAAAAPMQPELARSGKTRTRAFVIKDDGHRTREFKQDSAQTPDLDILGGLGYLAQSVLQTYNAEPASSEFTKESIETIKTLIANSDREGLLRFLQV